MTILLLPTSAEIEYQKEMRTNEYLKTIQWIEDNLPDYETIWMECVSSEDSFIEKYSKVFYSHTILILSIRVPILGLLLKSL